MVTEAPERPASPRTVSDDPPPKRVRPPASLLGIVVKIVALAVLDAILLYAVFVLIGTSQWIIAAIAILAGLLLNYIYLAPKVLAGKYLAPGIAFLLIFQVFVIVYSAYIGFTNYGDGHDGSKEDAVTAIEQNSLTRVPNSPAYQVAPIAQGSTIALLITDPDGKTVSLGENGKPLQTVTNATLTNGQATGLPGWSTLSLQQQQADQDVITKIAVPISSDLAKGAIRTADGSSGYLYQPTLRYDATKDEFTNLKTGRVYHDNGQGSFTSGDSSLSPGWTVTVGFQNFVSAFTEQGIAGPVVGVIIWTFVFAGLSTFLCFALGLFFAITFNHPTMRGKKAYRIIMILPYAFPSFLSALVWAGLLNQQFGFINSVLLGGAQVPWLSDPTLAKVSVLLVNLWMGFPYMFLVATGALQSIPDEVIEAGTVDGARPWAIFRLIKLPLLLVTMAPILIATFAFNFNNFNVIYLVTGGGPTDINAPINVGGSDILISLVYKIAFLGTNGRNYGLASAFSIIIFIIIATISIIAFRRTKSLEDVN